MRRIAVVMALLLSASGCDSGPDGPGDVTGTLRATGVVVGGAVLEVVAVGVQSFSGTGGTKVFWAPQADPKVHRVVVIGQGSGELEFRVSVEDRGRRKPKATVINLVGPDNRTLPVTADYKVRFSY